MLTPSVSHCSGKLTATIAINGVELAGLFMFSKSLFLRLSLKYEIDVPKRMCVDWVVEDKLRRIHYKDLIERFSPFKDSR